MRKIEILKIEDKTNAPTLDINDLIIIGITKSYLGAGIYVVISELRTKHVVRVQRHIDGLISLTQDNGKFKAKITEREFKKIVFGKVIFICNQIDINMTDAIDDVLDIFCDNKALIRKIKFLENQILKGDLS